MKRIDKGFLLLKGLKNAGFSFCGTSQHSDHENTTVKYNKISPNSTESFDCDTPGRKSTDISHPLHKTYGKECRVFMDEGNIEIAKTFMKIDLMMLKL